MLRRMGAEVIKIEPPGGGDWVRFMTPKVGDVSAMFEALNAGKQGLVLDLKNPAGAGVLKRLAASADVLVEGFRPGVMERLGVGWRELRQANPALVYCAISGYGADGPDSQRAGHDLNYLALAGVLGQAAPKQGPASPLPVQLADVAGGSMNAAIGILAALFDAQRTGHGRFVDVSMTEGALQLLLPALGDHFAGATPARGDGLLTGGAACYRVYATADGGELSVGALEPQFWAAFCAAIERPDLVAKQFAAMQPNPEIEAELAALIAGRTLAQWRAVFAEIDACTEPVLTLEEVADHPQHVARGVFVKTDDGRTQLAAIGPRFDGPPKALPPAPAPGQHTAAVLCAFGFEDAEISSLMEAGAVR